MSYLKSTIRCAFLLVVKHVLLIVLFSISIGNDQLVAQVQDSIYIHEIEYNGIKRTRKSFLKHFVGFDKGQTICLEQIEKAQQAILNTNFFSRVDYELLGGPQGNELMFIVEEKFTILPSIMGGSSKQNSWFVVGVNDFHFLGRGITLGAFYIYNQRSGFLSYINLPYIRGTKWGTDISGENGLTIEPVYFDNDISLSFNLNRINALVLGTRELNRYKQSVQFGINWRKETYVFHDEVLPTDIQLTEGEVHNRILGIFKYIDRSRLNQFEQYQFGYSYEMSMERALVNVDNRNFGRLTLEGKYFIRIGNGGNFASRAKVAITENNDTPFAPLYFDNFWNLRGVGYVAQRGTAELTLNAEYRQTLFSIGWVAIQGVAFVDYSGLRSPAGDIFEVLQSDHNQVFSGIGGRVNFKRITDFILRLDYGFSLKDSKNGFVFGANQYF
jgi:hypothetical protein